MDEYLKFRVTLRDWQEKEPDEIVTIALKHYQSPPSFLFRIVAHRVKLYSYESRFMDELLYSLVRDVGRIE
jgi:hypothetical protein